MPEYSLLKTIDLPMVESAGGLVCNQNFQVLLIFKRGKWDLPKGRLKGNGSSHSKTAIREVNEETGLDKDKLKVIGKIVSTWHSTRHKKENVLKKSHWYLMHYDGKNTDLKTSS